MNARGELTQLAVPEPRCWGVALTSPRPSGRSGDSDQIAADQPSRHGATRPRRIPTSQPPRTEKIPPSSSRATTPRPRRRPTPSRPRQPNGREPASPPLRRARDRDQIAHPVASSPRTIEAGSRASWSISTSSSESDILITVRPYRSSAAIALFGVIRWITMNSAEDFQHSDGVVARAVLTCRRCGSDPIRAFAAVGGPSSRGGARSAVKPRRGANVSAAAGRILTSAVIVGTDNAARARGCESPPVAGASSPLVPWCGLWQSEVE